jgi:uncharacterized protein YfdQ (DUF2303 family)
MSADNRTNFADAYDRGAHHAKVTPQTVNNTTVLLGRAPNGNHLIDSLERFQTAPSSPRGTFTFYDPASFAAYVNGHKGAGTRLFVDGGADKLAIEVVFDGHEPTTNIPGWHRHRAKLVTRTTDEWDTWLEQDKEQMNQADFSEFIDENMADIAAPAGADLLEIIKKFKVTRNISFAGAINLDNGSTQLQYDEQVSAEGSARQQIVVPEKFTLGLWPFEGSTGQKVSVTAKFRYRLDGPRLAVWYVLYRPDQVIESEFNARIADVAALTSLQPLFGDAPAAIAAL